MRRSVRLAAYAVADFAKVLALNCFSRILMNMGFVSVTRWRSRMGAWMAVGALLCLAGCTKQASVSPAEVPSRHAKKEPAREDKSGRRPRPLVAPPPAYGNKVVSLGRHADDEVL